MTRASSSGELVWVSGDYAVLHGRTFAFDQRRVAQAEELERAGQRGSERVGRVCEHREELGVAHGDVRQGLEVRAGLDVVELAEDFSADVELLEVHDVAGERAGLVAEDVVDLAELFGERRALHFGCDVCVEGGLHACVFRDDVCLEVLDHLVRDHQRDRDEAVEDQQPLADVDRPVDEPAFLAADGVVFVELHVPQRALVDLLVDDREDREEQTGADLQHRDVDDLPVHHALEQRHLRLGLHRVEHDLGLVAVVGHQAVHALGVAQHAASEHEAAVVQRQLRAVRQLDRAAEAVEVRVRPLELEAQRLCGQLRAVRTREELQQPRVHALLFEVRLAVEVLGLHEAVALLFARVEQDQVCRHLLVFLDLDHLPDQQAVPGGRLEALRSEDLGLLRGSYPAQVFASVGLASLEVFEDVLEDVHGQDDAQREEHHGPAFGRGDGFDHGEQADDQEVDVREPRELLVEVQRQHVDPGVLVGLDAVVAEGLVGLVQPDCTVRLLLPAELFLEAAQVRLPAHVVVLAHYRLLR